MCPWEVNYRACERLRGAIAELLGKSASIVDKYCAMPAALGGNGESSPTQHFLDFLLAVHRAGGVDRSKILLDHLLSEVGFLPAQSIDASDSVATVFDAARAMSEFADFLAACARALTSETLTITHLVDLEQELTAAIDELARQLQCVRRARASEESRQLHRLPPRRAPASRIATRRTA